MLSMFCSIFIAIFPHCMDTNHKKEKIYFKNNFALEVNLDQIKNKNNSPYRKLPYLITKKHKNSN